jgi:protein-S-isoprenylcysteine O-methyltransferase Ste14
MALLRIVLSGALATAMFALLVFWPAGRFDWIGGWVYLGLVYLNFAINIVYLGRVNPGLIESRSRIGPGTKAWDFAWAAFFGPLFVSIFVVAGFDAVRYEWTHMSAWWLAAGIAVFVPGTGLFSWAMGVNPFFEKTVRIQSERGHRVIDTGPYQYVRHPGYVGFFSWCIATPWILGSWWAFVPAFLSVAAIVIRTALEDRTLKRELAGYDEYAARVRYRLIPGVW